MRQKAFAEYRVDGVLSAAFSVVLGDKDGTYGIKVFNGPIVVANETSVDNPSVGVYSKVFEALPNTVYWVSWKIIPNNGDEPTYAVEEIGPFADPISSIRATTDVRGRFTPDKIGTVFLRISDFEGRGIDSEDIIIDILDNTSTTVTFGVPERVDLGFYAWDWAVPFETPFGDYYAKWSYFVDGVEHLYSGRTVEMRQALSAMIYHAQSIPVYREPAKQSRDKKTYEFNFGRWNQSAGVRIYRNDILVTDGFTIDYFKGKVTFDKALTVFDRVEAGYNFRWYPDDQLDRFLSNAIHLLNVWPPVTSYNTVNVDDKWIAIVLYGAAVDAIRNLMLSLQFQEPQLVFGGAERADKVFSALESIKKNYEETWTKALEQKKNGPYKGLTRFMSTPEFALPGGRSRMFRYLFSSGV
jgi:hypothetical protein